MKYQVEVIQRVEIIHVLEIDCDSPAELSNAVENLESDHFDRLPDADEPYNLRYAIRRVKEIGQKS